MIDKRTAHIRGRVAVFINNSFFKGGIAYLAHGTM